LNQASTSASRRSVTGFLIGRYHSILSGTTNRRFGSSATACKLIVFGVFLRFSVFRGFALRPFVTALDGFIYKDYTYISMLTPLPVQMFQLEHSAHMFRLERFSVCKPGPRNRRRPGS
jgi:hypothetical protein